MADNTRLNAGTAGDLIATDEIAGVKYPRSKITIGADGTNDGDVSSANPLPVDITTATIDVMLGTDFSAVLGTSSVIGGGTEAGAIRVTIANDSTGVLTVDGTVTANAGTGTFTVDNGGTFATQVDGAALTALQLIDDPVFADNAAFTLTSSKVMMSGAIRDDSLSSLAAVEGDAVPLRVGMSGELWTAVSNVVTTSTTITGTATVDNAGTFAVQVDAALPAGTNAIGKLAANSGVDIGDVDVITQPARDRLTDNVGVALQTDVILQDTTARTPVSVAINATVASGDNTIVVAQGAGNKIRVLAYTLVADAAVGCAFEDGAGGTELTGQMPFAANGGISCPFNPVGWFETAANTLLNLELDAAANVRGHLVYIVVT